MWKLRFAFTVIIDCSAVNDLRYTASTSGYSDYWFLKREKYFRRAIMDYVEKRMAAGMFFMDFILCAVLGRGDELGGSLDCLGLGWIDEIGSLMSRHISMESKR